jgi:ketosteroid isomerase-like protein
VSHENLDLVKRFIPPAGTDYTNLFRDDAVWAAARDARAPFLDPDFEGAFVIWGHREMEFTGFDGMREAFLEWLAPWTSYFDEIEDVFAVGDDRVVALGRQHGHRLDTGSEVQAETAGVYLLRNGKIARVDYYASQAEALDAVGLTERDVRRT